MGSSQHYVAVFAAALLACVGCQNQPREATQANPSTHSTRETKPNGIATPSKVMETKPKPRMFGFNVTNVSVELCCSDRPGKPTPTGETSIEGVTPDNVRFMLSCLPDSYADFVRPDGKISKVQRDRWYAVGTASIESGEHGDEMTIYSFGGKPPDDWKAFAECSVLGRLDRAQNEIPVLVYSSSAGDWKDGSGYAVDANSRIESFALKCLQGVQSPCVSVAPGTYRGIRDGSEMRLCDQNLAVVATYRIIGERFLR